MDRRAIPRAAAERLPMYLKALRDAQAEGVAQLSSAQIGRMSGGNSAQVRKDFSYIGDLGMKGSGYDVDHVVARLVDVIGVATPRRGALFGHGWLGAALFSHGESMSMDFEVVAVFDSDPKKIGTTVDGITIQGLDEVEAAYRERAIEVAVIATPPEFAQDVADVIVAAGGRAILNMTPQHVEVPGYVHVRHACLCTELHSLSFLLARDDSRVRTA